MDSIFFNRDEAIKDYRRQYPDDNRTVELLMLRSELLTYNKLFVNEFNRLKKDDKNEVKSFCNRWNVIHGSYLSRPLKAATFEPFEPHHVANARLKNDPNYYEKEEPFINIKIDLRFSNKRILEEVSKIITEERLYLEDVLYDCKESVIEPTGNVSSDLSDYRNYLHVYKLRLEGKSWNYIVNKMNLNSISTARNWYSSAEKLINNGIPTLPKFPEFTIEEQERLKQEQERMEELSRPWQPGCDVNGMPLDPNHPWYQK